VASRRIVVAVRIASIALVVVLLWLLAHRVDWRELGRAFRHAEVWPLVLAAAFYFLSLFGKSIVWRLLLAPKYVVPLRRLVRYTVSAFAAAVLTPARAGEVVRIVALKRGDGVAACDASGVLVADKLLHAMSLVMLAAPLPLLLPSLPAWVEDSLLVCASVAVGMLVAIYFAVGKVIAREPQSWFARFLAGMHAVRDPRRVLASLAVLGIVWCCDLASVMCVLAALDIDLSIAGGLFILFTLNLAIAIPTTPANLGTFQLGALVGTGLLHIPREPALAFALLYQGVQIIPVLVAGGLLEMRLGGRRVESGKLAV
jgi:glycosyltransferase 2 family protein